MATDLTYSQLILLVHVGSNFRLYFEREMWLNLRCLGCGYSRQLWLPRLLISLACSIPRYKLIGGFLLDLRLYTIFFIINFYP